eukprot:GHVU01187282.1.p1 GENE.GHVU01187282.1~~GHVU01187282.1.p1  ORF type:complete len:242 (-),score=51.06 GHVU01187282.1:39-764(-)
MIDDMDYGAGGPAVEDEVVHNEHKPRDHVRFEKCLRKFLEGFRISGSYKYREQLRNAFDAEGRQRGAVEIDLDDVDSKGAEWYSSRGGRGGHAGHHAEGSPADSESTPGAEVTSECRSEADNEGTSMIDNEDDLMGGEHGDRTDMLTPPEIILQCLRTRPSIYIPLAEALAKKMFIELVHEGRQMYKETLDEEALRNVQVDVVSRAGPTLIRWVGEGERERGRGREGARERGSEGGSTIDE